MNLTKAQQAALDYIAEYARLRALSAKETIDHILKMSNISTKQYHRSLRSIENSSRIAVHFHPDRMVKDGKSVIESLLQSGKYQNQFESGISNGSVSAFLGGQRDKWEREVFGGAYHSSGMNPEERPNYGALHLMPHPDGPAPRFGSCYFLLRPEVSKRSTFTYYDSHTNPLEKGTISEFSDIFAAMLEEAFTRNFALGEHNLTIKGLLAHLSHLNNPLNALSSRSNAGNLDHYVEAQIHGDIMLHADIDYLVADPCFQQTSFGELFEQLCAKYHIYLKWHHGFRLKPELVPPDFRGPSMPSLAKRVAKQNFLDVSQIGEAARSLQSYPEAWSDRGTYPEVLQEFKLLWHVLVKFGKARG